MKEKQYGYKKILNIDFVLIWFSIFMSFLCGYIINGGATYIFATELFSDLLFLENVITFLIILFLLSFLFVIVLIKYKFEKVTAIWSRILLCIIMPLSIESIFVIIFGNDTVNTLMIKMNLDQGYLEGLIFKSMLAITIISGQIFIKPWRSFLNFFIGTFYVALMNTILLFYYIYLAGIIYGNWI